MTDNRSQGGPCSPTEGRAVSLRAADPVSMTGNGPACDRRAVTLRPERPKQAQNAPRFLGRSLGGNDAAKTGHDAPTTRAQAVTNRPRLSQEGARRDREWATNASRLRG